MAGRRPAVDGSRLTIGTSLTSTDDEAFPAGFGHHPFFRRGIIDPVISEVCVQVPAEGAYAMRDRIPEGAAGPVPARVDYRRLRALDGAFVNECFTQAPGADSARLEWPASGIAVSLASGVRGHGVFVLEPGQTRSGDITLDVADLEVCTGESR